MLGDAETTVNAEVDLVFVGINVTAPNPVDYGVMEVDDISEVQGPIIVENSGNVNVDFALKGDNASNGSNTWTLTSGSGSDQFRHAWAHDPYTFPTDFDGHALTTNYSDNSIATNVVPTGTDTIKTVLHMPTYSSEVGTYTTKIWVRAVAH